MKIEEPHEIKISEKFKINDNTMKSMGYDISKHYPSYYGPRTNKHYSPYYGNYIKYKNDILEINVYCNQIIIRSFFSNEMYCYWGCVDEKFIISLEKEERENKQL